MRRNRKFGGLFCGGRWVGEGGCMGAGVKIRVGLNCWRMGVDIGAGGHKGQGHGFKGHEGNADERET